MSKCTTVAMVLAFAACEHQSIRTRPTPEPARTAAQPIAPQPIAPRPVPPAPAIVVEPPVAPAPRAKIKCNPMSRAGCRWDQEVDERSIQRVVKKQPEQESP